MILKTALIIILEKSELVHNSLPIAKKLTIHSVMILIKSVVNKNKNEYYCNIFIEKDSHKDEFDTRFFQMNFYML